MLLLFLLTGLLLFFVLALILILGSTLSVLLNAEFSNGRLDASAQLMLWKKTIWQGRISETNLEEMLLHALAESDEWKESARGRRSAQDVFSRRKSWMRVFRSIHWSDQMHVRHFQWQTVCGTGDAPLTALCCGFIWAMKSAVLPLIGQMTNQNLHVTVHPLFRQMTFRSRLSCMVTIKTGKAIGIVRQIVKQMKGGEKRGRSSNSGANENSAGKYPVND
ncbi:DUF2953 domain-containing protein [Sporolactobacillus sp. THM19-2]|uniref:DUF2953 domain-containing protein n=1 Tax=Sporolactobacillus sp. THM19-2 TaxID=2511171 RepID=UPI001021967D|nr:DUF2953 domain-containing protein [Sporolactobacillus sp. THM19-2]RYL94590.1 DUF2953 domain-containing protein [Sporolactobacillus sp. THM19-2]